MSESKTQTPLDEIADFTNGYGFSPGEMSDAGDPIVRIEQLLNPQAPCDRYDGQLNPRFRIRTGDIVMSWSGTIKVVRWDRGRAWLNQHLFRVDPKAGTDPRFVRHVLQEALPNLVAAAHGTTMKHIKRRDLLQFKVIVPELEEQRRIAEILDTIDETIQATERVIAKLSLTDEGAAAELVVRCGGPKVTLGSVASLSSGSTPNRERTDYWGGAIPWVKTGEVRGHAIQEVEEKITEKALAECPLRIYACNTILVAMYGQGNTRGRVAMLALPAATNQACAAVEPDLSLAEPVFVFEVLRSSYQSIRALSQGSHQENLSTSLLAEFEFNLPDLDSQRKVVADLKVIRHRQAEERRILSKLQGVRSALTSDLLSGCVRTVAS
jgi:type I restriction enzyme, S subunit